MSFSNAAETAILNQVFKGVALPSTATSAALWKIRKIETIGAVTTVAYADGNSLFDNIWDDRLSLTYS